MTNLSVLFSTDNIPATLSALSHSWKEIEQVYPFEYTFFRPKVKQTLQVRGTNEPDLCLLLIY
jgi:hypothetical protein